MDRRWIALAGVALLASCTSSKINAATPTQTTVGRLSVAPSDSTSASTPRVTAVSSTAAPTTATASTTTTSAPATTAAQGHVISRATALAANTCFEQWTTAQFEGYGNVFDAGTVAAADGTCKTALANLDLDTRGAPFGSLRGTPVLVLQSALQAVDQALGLAQIAADLISTQGNQDCSTVCTVSGPWRDHYMELTDPSLPAKFAGQHSGLNVPSIDDIPGLDIATA